MNYCIIESDGFIVGTASSEHPFQKNVSEGDANAIKQIFAEKPVAPDGYDYMLRADTLEWELVELPPMPEPEPTAEELLDIILGGAT